MNDFVPLIAVLLIICIGMLALAIQKEKADEATTKAILSQDGDFSVLVCPLCDGKELISEETSGKTIGLRCTGCGTVLGTDDMGKSFTIITPGEAYSNTLLSTRGKKFSPDELGNHNIPTIPDKFLEDFADGNIPEMFFHDPGELGVPMVLQDGEKVVIVVRNVTYKEERRVKVPGTSGSVSMRIGPGMWYHTGSLSSPQYASILEELDRGTLYVTESMYFFIGAYKSINQSLSKITAILPFSDGIGISRSGKQKIEYYLGDHHWPLTTSLMMGLAKKKHIDP